MSNKTISNCSYLLMQYFLTVSILQFLKGRLGKEEEEHSVVVVVVFKRHAPLSSRIAEHMLLALLPSYLRHLDCDPLRPRFFFLSSYSST